MNKLGDISGVSFRSKAMNPGSPAPDFEFGDDGGVFRLSQFKGSRLVLLAFCTDVTAASCRDAIRTVKNDWPDYWKRGLITIVVSPVSEDVLRRFAREEAIPVVMISDERRETISSYGVRVSDTPTVFLIGKDGTIQASWTHWPSSEEVFQVVDSTPVARPPRPPRRRTERT